MPEAQTDDKKGDQSFEEELSGKYLSFKLRNEAYGCPIGPINDIIELKEITSVPQTSDYLKGVINLRGTVIPVLDLRLKFGMEPKEYDRKTVIIVVQMEGVETGLIVDRVDEVVSLADSDVETSPNMGSQVNSDFLAGIGHLDEDVLMLLELQRILEDDEMDELEDVQAKQAT